MSDAPSPEDEIPLDDRIAQLSALLKEPLTEVDRAKMLGLLGNSFVELFERDGGLDTLNIAIRHLHDAVQAAPFHDDRTSWYHGLGLAYAKRALERSEDRDFDLTVDWLLRLHCALPAGDPELDYVSILLVDSYWERFWFHRYENELEAAAQRVEVDRLMSGISAVRVSDDDPVIAAYVRMLTGFGHLERYSITEERTELDHGIAGIASALPQLPADTPWLGPASAELTDAYQARAALDNDSESLDLSIATGEAAIEASDPDQPSWGLLHQYQMTGYWMRWDESGDADALDRAIRCGRVLLDRGGDDWAIDRVGRLLLDRAELAGDLPDCDEAIALLEDVVQSATKRSDSAGQWYDLGRACHLRWKLGHEAGHLETAKDCFEQAVQAGTADHDLLMKVHVTRLTVSDDLVKLDKERPLAERPQRSHWLRMIQQEAHDALDRAITAHPDMRSVLACVLAFHEFWLYSLDLLPPDAIRIRGLLALAKRLREPPSYWQTLIDLGDGMLQHWNDLQRSTPGTDRGVTELARAMTSGEAGMLDAEGIWTSLSLAASARSIGTGDVRSSRAAVQTLRHVVPELRPPSAALPQALPVRLPDSVSAADGAEAELIALVYAGFQHAQLGQHEEFQRYSARAAEIVETISTESGAVRALMPVVHSMLALAAVGRKEPVASVAAALPSERLPGVLGVVQEFLGLAGPLAEAVLADDLPAIRRHASRLDAISDDVPPTHYLRVSASGLAGTALREVARRDPFTLTAARRAVHRFGEAVDLALGPQHPLWASLSLGLADSMRLAGDPDLARTRQLGASCLEGHAWQVTLQSGTEYASEVARKAAIDAYTVAGWCLDDHAYDDLVAVLDAGRALALNAATMSREIADQLVDIGRSDLASEWLTTAGLGRDHMTGKALDATTTALEVPDDLRSQVLQALGSHGSAPQRLTSGDQIRVADIQSSLSAAQADAFVYLMPAVDSRPGVAVIVPVSGPVDVLRLPELTTDAGSLIDRYSGRPGTNRDAGPVGGYSAGISLDEICQWAWRAAVDDLLTYLRRRRLPRPARLIMVPMGQLALVPWHAAYVSTGTGRRYAIEDVVFSYAISARMFRASASQPSLPIRSALLVGNPTGDLHFAGIEARAIKDRFYPDGTYFGEPGDEAAGAGTPEQVLDWITASAPGPSMLHLACHGWIDPSRPADAHLVLADGQRLTARRLLEVCRLAALEIDQVFLAACTTNSTGADYDEAFSLASVFLSAGAHTVFGSMWPVPDADTSLLMFMVHHYLNTLDCSAAQALHKAQLWMIDPQRRPPIRMPKSLIDFCQRPETADPAAWAGFNHLGR